LGNLGKTRNIKVCALRVRMLFYSHITKKPFWLHKVEGEDSRFGEFYPSPPFIHGLKSASMTHSYGGVDVIKLFFKTLIFSR
jgi:hypothetical protein